MWLCSWAWAFCCFRLQQVAKWCPFSEFSYRGHYHSRVGPAPLAQNLNPLCLQQRLKEAALHLYFIVIASTMPFDLLAPLLRSSLIEPPKPLTSRISPHQRRCGTPNRKRYTNTDGWHLFATVQYSSGKCIKHKWFCNAITLLVFSFFSPLLEPMPLLFSTQKHPTSWSWILLFKHVPSRPGSMMVFIPAKGYSSWFHWLT